MAPEQTIASARSRLRAPAVAVFGALTCACISHVVVPYRPAANPGWHAPAANSSSPFGYDPLPFDPQSQPLADLESDEHRVFLSSFSSVGDNGQEGHLVTFQYFQSKRPGARKAFMVLPLWGSHTYPPAKITRGLLQRHGGDAHVLRVLGERYLFDWAAATSAPTPDQFRAIAQRMSDRFRVTVIDLRRLVDWMELQPEIDPQRIGLVGFSMSAVVGALLLGADSRPAAAALVMGGALIGTTLAHCDGPFEPMRETIMSRFDWSRARYQSVTGAAFEHVDPANHPTRVDPAGIVYFESQYDTCMPASSREAYWQALGQPRRVSFKYRHKTAFLAMTPLGFNLMRRMIYAHFDANL